MKTKHTQGKWEYFISKTNNKKNTSKICVKIPPSTILTLGTINHDDECNVVDCCNIEEHANAQLISAAPELLEACKELICLLRFHGYLHSSEITKAEFAIKKAIGE